MRWVSITISLALVGCDASSGEAVEYLDAQPIRFDLGPPPPDLAFDPAECETACRRIAACAAAPDDVACPGVGPGGEESFASTCTGACASGFGFAESAGALSECPALVDFARRAAPALAIACVDEPMLHPECAAFATRLTECVVQACPPGDAVSVGLRKALERSCDLNVTAEVVSAADIAAQLGADTDCDVGAPPVYVEQITGAGGQLGLLCADGPPLSPEACDASCAALRRCLPPGGDLHDADLCRYFCLTTPSLTDAFKCATRTFSCEAVATCF